MNPRKPDRSAGHGEARPPARPRSGAPHRAPAENTPAVPDGATRIQPPPASAARQALIEGAAAENGNGRRRKEKKPKGKIKKSTVFKIMFLNVLKALFVIFCITAMVGSVMAVQVVQYVVEATEDDDTLLDLENYQMNQTSYFMIYDPDHPEANEEGYRPYQELVGDEDRIWVDLEDIPQNLINAVIATEDREFETHKGVNWRRTVAAFANEFITVDGMRGGASTITQQLIKNITDDDVVSKDGDRTAGYMRKIREIYRALTLENRYSKEMIMESYLNTIGLSERIAGVGAGAKRYFNKEVKDLTLAECAVIAGITQAPTKYSPIQNPEESLKRRNNVLYFMEQAGFITTQVYEETCKLPLGLDVPSAAQRKSDNVFSYISDKAYDDVINDLVAQGVCETRSEAVKKLYNGGLKVYLTADLRVQNKLDEIMVNGYEEDGFFMNEAMFPGYARTMTRTTDVKNSAGVKVDTKAVLPQVAVAVVNYKGELIATSGGIGEKTVSLGLNRAIGTVTQDANGEYQVRGAVRQNGSTMKPMAAYAVGIDYGIIHYSKMVTDVGVRPRNQAAPSRDAETGAVKNDWPRNYSGEGSGQKWPVVSALAESLNTVPCQIGLWVGLPTMFEFLVDTLQISTLVDPADMDLAPLVLGAQTYGMSVYEVAGAYTIFGGDDTYGQFNSLHCYTKVVDSKGNIVMEPEITSVQAISPDAGYVMNRLLNTVLGGATIPRGAPTANGMRPVDADGNVIPAVAKTGTTSEDYDRWFVGLTPQYVTAVWWGYDAGYSDKNLTLYPWGPGARNNIPVNVWKALIEGVWPELTEEERVKQFPDMPETVQVQRFCTVSGELAGAGCPSMEGYYTETGVPSVCVGHAAEEDDPAAEG